MLSEKMFSSSSLPVEVIREVHIPGQIGLFKSNHLFVFIKLHGVCRVTKANANPLLGNPGWMFEKSQPAIRLTKEWSSHPKSGSEFEDAGRMRLRIFSGSLLRPRPAWPYLPGGYGSHSPIVCATENHCSPSNPIHAAWPRSARCSISQPMVCCERAVKIRFPQCERESCISVCRFFRFTVGPMARTLGALTCRSFIQRNT